MAAEFSAAHESADARFLADEGTALSAWVGAGIAMVGMLVAACTIGTAAFLYQRHRSRSVSRDVQKMQLKAGEGGKKPQAWPDPERGMEGNTVIDKATAPHDLTVAPDKLSASVRQELAETLRGILEDEISRGLKASGISDRLDRLEKQAKEHQVLSGSLLPPPGKRVDDLDSTWDMKVPQAGTVSPELAATLKGSAAKCDASTVTVQSLRDVATITEEAGQGPAIGRVDSGFNGERKNLTLSPSGRQKRYADPPEKPWVHIDEDRSLRASFSTTQRNLRSRDIQTQELSRQLRGTQQDCLNQKLEATHAVRKLQDLLSNPSYAPQAQALELQACRMKIEDLSSKLADSKQAEMQWGLVAKRQRAFFMQSERVAQEGVNVFRKHPAGELFLAPPPVYLQDDVEEDPRNPPWDIGNSHINPYVNDSWPFEPNACAQRCAAEPNLGRWDEEDGIVESDSEDGSLDEDLDRGQLRLRLPTLPPNNEDFDPPEPSEPLPALPELEAGGMSSSRSL